MDRPQGYRQPTARPLGTAIAAALTLSACAVGTSTGQPAQPPVPQGPTRVVRAEIPTDIGPDSVGIPLGPGFAKFFGPDGASLFPGVQPVLRPINEFHSEHTILETSEDVNANVRAGIISVGGGYGQGLQYAVYRAALTVNSWQVPDGAAMGRPPPVGAAYYVSAVYFGFSATTTFQGDRSTISTSFGLTFPVWGLSVTDAQSRYHVQANTTFRGLAPRNPAQVLLAGDDQLQNAYLFDTRAPPMPIIVEYRTIPNAMAPPKRVSIRFTDLRAGEAGSVWYGHSGWELDATCSVNGMPPPQSTPIVKQDVNDGQAYAAPGPSIEIEAADADTIECVVSGHHTRGEGAETFGQVTTGPILGRSVNPSVMGQIHGSSAYASYTMTWTMSRMP